MLVEGADARRRSRVAGTVHLAMASASRRAGAGRRLRDGTASGRRRRSGRDAPGVRFSSTVIDLPVERGRDRPARSSSIGSSATAIPSRSSASGRTAPWHRRNPMRDEVAIVGVGSTEFSRDAGGVSPGSARRRGVHRRDPTTPGSRRARSTASSVPSSRARPRANQMSAILGLTDITHHSSPDARRGLRSRRRDDGDLLGPVRHGSSLLRLHARALELALGGAGSLPELPGRHDERRAQGAADARVDRSRRRPIRPGPRGTSTTTTCRGRPSAASRSTCARTPRAIRRRP